MRNDKNRIRDKNTRMAHTTEMSNTHFDPLRAAALNLHARHLPTTRQVSPNTPQDLRTFIWAHSPNASIRSARVHMAMSVTREGLWPDELPLVDASCFRQDLVGLQNACETRRRLCEDMRVRFDGREMDEEGHKGCDENEEDSAQHAAAEWASSEVSGVYRRVMRRHNAALVREWRGSMTAHAADNAACYVTSAIDARWQGSSRFGESRVAEVWLGSFPCVLLKGASV